MRQNVLAQMSKILHLPNAVFSFAVGPILKPHWANVFLLFPRITRPDLIVILFYSIIPR